MKKLITLSIITLISFTQLVAKPIINSGSSSNYKDKIILASADLEPVNAHVNFTIPKACKGTLVVVDESGITVLKQQVMLVAGKNKITITDISSLNEGNYTVCLNTSYKTYSTAFVLWK